MADDYSDLGSPPALGATPGDAIQADASPAAVPPAAVQAAAAANVPVVAEDYSDLGAYPSAGPSGDLATDIPRRLATAGADALSGIVGMPRAIAQGVDYLGNKVGLNIGADQALARQTMWDGRQSFPDAQSDRNEIFQKTGATEYVPATAAGRAVQAGLAAAPAALLTGGLGAVVPAMVGGGAGEVAAEMLPDHPNLARLGGFVAGAAGASGLMNAGAKVAGMVTGTAPTTPLYDAYKRQGIPTDLSGDVTQNPALQRWQSIATKMPGGEDVMREKINQAVDAWQTAAERAASQLGPSTTMAEAGGSLQSAARQWLQDFKDNSSANWNNFQQAVPGDTPINVDGFQKALRDVNQNFGGADELAKALQPGLPGKLQGALEKDTAAPPAPVARATGLLDASGNPITVAPSPGEMTAWLQAVQNGGKLPWQAVQSIRTRLGEMMEGGQPIGDTAQSAIKRLYAGLSNDMRDGANAAGPDASRAFNQANAYTAFGHGMLDDHLGPILNATEPGQAARYALGQSKIGASRLAAIDNVMPGQAANLGAAVLRQAAEDGPAGLPTALKKISPEAKPLLFSSPQPVPAPPPGGWPAGTQNWAITQPPPGLDPAFESVNDLSDISRAMRRTVQTTGNNSNTAAHGASGIGRVMSAIEMGKAGHEIAGLPGAVAGTTAGFFAPNMVGKGARMLGANRLMSRVYSTDVAPFSAPGAMSPNALLQYGMPDQRRLGSPNMNPLLFGPEPVASDPIATRR